MIARSTVGIRSAGKEVERRQRYLDTNLDLRDISLAATKNNAVDVEVEGAEHARVRKSPSRRPLVVDKRAGRNCTATGNRR